MSNDSTQAAPSEPKRRGKGLVIALVLTLVVLAAGGAAAWWFLVRPASAAPAHPAPQAAHGLVTMEPFVVNLADRDASRFLRVTIRLVVPEEEEAKHVEEDAVLVNRLRSAVIELLAEQVADRLVTPDGKQALRKSLRERASHILGKVKVVDVLFTDFLVQF